MSKKAVFEIGEIVKLKSGGPDMTVKDISTDFQTGEFLGKYRCQWFAGKKLDSGDFPQESLLKVEDSE